MKAKSFLALLLTLPVLSLAACSGGGAEPTPDEPSAHTLYVRDAFHCDEVTATFFSTESSERTTVALEKIAEDTAYDTLSCTADPAIYDRVILTYDDEDTIELAYNEFVSGWYLSSYRVVPFTYDKPWEDPPFTTELFDYADDQKPVYIWTPEDYDPDAAEKYSVIYMTDGQNLFNHSATSTGCWGVAHSVESMMALSGNKAIVVGIDDATSNRDSELTPNLGKSEVDSYDNGTGAYYSDFVADTVVPYIEAHYNVYTDPAHNAICGSSSGGIESFYIGMEHPEKFGNIGALSPAFGLFSTELWSQYLGAKNLGEDSPFVYIYCGNNDSDALEQFLMVGAQSMPDTLKAAGMPEDHIVFKEYNKGVHNEMYWRAVFPDFLKYMFRQ